MAHAGRRLWRVAEQEGVWVYRRNDPRDTEA
jgi:hypothetical protein